MRFVAVALVAIAATMAPAVAMAANHAETYGRPGVIAFDSRALADARVERNGKDVGRLQRVMIAPNGRVDHVDILMTEGQNRVVSVPWSDVKVYQDTTGHYAVSLTSRAASEAAPASTAPIVLDTRSAQRELKDAGYYSGAVDGVIGPKTRAALRDYQRDQGLAVTGRLDARTASRLSSEAPTPSASPATEPARHSMR